jgi:hypothetical protein
MATQDLDVATPQKILLMLQLLVWY